MTGPHGVRGKLLAVGLLVAVAFAAYALVIEPVYDGYVRTGEAIAQSERLLADYRRLGAARPALEARLAELEAREDRRGDYLEAASDTLAAAALQGQLRQLFERTGAVQRSVQALPSTQVDGMIRVSVRSQFTAETEALAAILHALETGRPFLFVDDLDIRREMRRRRVRDRASAEEMSAGPLSVRLDVYGYMRADDGAAP
jgi:general secretion pathway protein M